MSYATIKDMTGTSHETAPILKNSDEMIAISEMKLLTEINETMDRIAAIDRILNYEILSRGRMNRLIKKREIMFGKIALKRDGLTA